MKKDLTQLLQEASKLFRANDWKKSKLTCYDFTLNKMPYGWIFSVTNSWYKWLDKELEYSFGAYNKPEYAIQAFLNYVKDNKINVKKLMS
jgi:hypothetical protein